MFKHLILRFVYKNLVKPVLFLRDAEKVHDSATRLSRAISKTPVTKSFVKGAFLYQNDWLKQKINGVEYPNPVGLAAGFDYNGYMAQIMPAIGFGFSTVGTVTAQKYQGNPPPRLGRLPKSKALLVNKGFKSEGGKAVAKRLDKCIFDHQVLGVSIGSSNVPEGDNIAKAIDDYIKGFDVFKNKKYVKYFELNISCPNTDLGNPFKYRHNLKVLLKEVGKLKIKQPIYVKMANELELNRADRLTKTGIELGMSGFIFSNLVKDRTNKYLHNGELAGIKDLKGNFSGRPTFQNSNKLIKHIYKEYGRHTTIIGCGGIFSAEDAYEKIKLGASLVQLITGMVYEGPQLIGEINAGLVKLLKRDGYKNISEAVGNNLAR